MVNIQKDRQLIKAKKGNSKDSALKIILNIYVRAS